MLRRLLILPIVLVTAGVLITVFVANRHPVRLVLDPISDVPVLAFEMPFYVYLAGALILGVLLGGMRTWVGQSHWRRSARVRAQEAMRWQAEADRLQREREQMLIDSRQPAGSASSRALAVMRP